ncbi:MAG: hypothetical protein Q4F24_07925 [Eubacteriales bacterium]|nr:hypothetical protein [Eubacteriales bacterium]
MKEITYTNIFVIDGKPVKFLDMPKEQRVSISNQMRRIPLETLGEVYRIHSA